jgi:tRNA threonylcarbamoyladenosine modification (KEOPS) complex  Pcc1 subunit
MRRLLAAATAAVVLTACSSSGSPQADLQTRMNAVVNAANAKDAAQLRGAVEDFLREVTSQSQNGDITSTKAQDLRIVADRLLTHASLLDQPSPTPAPSSAAPSPSPSPTSAAPSPSPTPAPPSPSPTEAPPSPSPLASIGLSGSPAPLVPVSP